MKKLLLRGAIVLVVLAVIAVVALVWNLDAAVKKGVETAGPLLTRTTVRLDKVSLSLLGGSAQLRGLVVCNPEGYKTESAIKVADMKVAVKISSVLSDVVLIDTIQIDGPEITFEGGLGGNNLSKILENVEAASGGGKTPDPTVPPPASGKKFRVKEVQITNGKINASITGPVNKSLTLPLPPVRVENIGTDGEGVNAAELTRAIIKPLLASVTKAVADGISGLGGAAGETINKATGGIKDLFKKKE